MNGEPQQLKRPRIPLLLLALCSLGAAACGGRRFVYRVASLPAIVNPGGGDWGVDIQVDFSRVLLVRLANQGTEPIKVLWDECAYIDIDDRSHRVLTTDGSRLSQQPPSIIAPGTHLQEILRPVPMPGDSGVDPLLPAKRPVTLITLDYLGDATMTPARRRALVGKQLGLLLVLERDGERKTVRTRYAITTVKS